MTFFKLRLLAAFSVFALFLSITPTVFAQSPESFGLTPQKTLPGSSGYLFKRVKEKVTKVFKFSKNSKYQFQKGLLERRVSEYVSLVEKNEQSQISDASQRLAFEAGILAESSVEESKEKKTEIISLFEKYKPILGKMRDNFPANTPFWLLSQQDIDTMNILTEKLK
ncbi:MAG: hypothetical protein UT17_C0004G0174 [Candidatus Woesebacteria bacterium GW2011_GWB1_39_10]|uniref:DUF5667 domain-containing protein n=2 Tax=Candidatus Woeseibacteriota TaxID=1752722 RepID=A0A0G0PR27_9BACT|nr:MAG: hypothetical protein UT17_C0004G0174 [Candidatus Woesebacteria bacterium GW2011_GWB1_39_10]KKS90816.1 MAG: hypothetical protein UV66_C0001G0173 [Candidatus Woesebacteria bacterium GW2011_GWA1_43_12]